MYNEGILFALIGRYTKLDLTKISNKEISNDEILKSNQLVDDMVLKDKKGVLSRKEQLEELRGYAINLKFLESDGGPQNLSSCVGIKK